MLGVHRSPEHVDISSMRCPDASFAAFVRVSDQDSARSTQLVNIFYGALALRRSVHQIPQSLDQVDPYR
jgi:hypothetical protein